MIKVIVDTDEGSDPDCAAAGSLLNRLQDLGECEIIAYCSYHSDTYCAQCIEAQVSTYGRYIGRGEVPIGINKTDVDDGWPLAFHGDDLAAYFTNLYRMATPYTDAITIMRTALAGQPDDSVTYLLTGPLYNLHNLYNSAGDGISPLTGAELIAAKVTEMVIMGGDYPSGEDEYNFLTDAPISQIVNSLDDLGIKVVYAGFTLGNSVTYNCSAAADYSYVKTAYRISGAVGGNDPYENQSYDSLAALYAVRGLSHGATTYFNLSAEGRCVVDAVGDNTWEEGAYNQWYLASLGISTAAMAIVLQDLMCAAPSVPIQRQVAASTDDKEIFKAGDTVWSVPAIDREFLVAGHDTTYNVYKDGMGVRFLNVTIPKGAVIAAARLLLKAQATETGATVNTEITGDLEPNCATFGTLADYQARRGTEAGGADNTKRTTAQVAWDSITNWYPDIWHYSPDFKTVIQEIVNQEDWESGNALAVWWDDHEGRGTVGAGKTRRCYSYDQAGNVSGPILQIVLLTITTTTSPGGLAQAALLLLG